MDRALVPEPELLILEEPTEGIQPKIVHEIGGGRSLACGAIGNLDEEVVRRFADHRSRLPPGPLGSGRKHRLQAV